MTPVTTPDAPTTETAASSPAPASEPRTLDSLSDTERHEWRLTGKLPDPSTEQPPPAGTAPAEPDAQAAGTAASAPPAPEPGKPSKQNAETRKAQLASEIEGLLKQRAEIRLELDSLRQPPARPQSAPAASEPAGPRSLGETVQYPDIARPALTEEDFFVQYPDAKMADFVRYVSRYEYTAQEQFRQVASVRQQRVDTFKSRMDKAGVNIADQTFWADIDPRIAKTNALDMLAPGESAGPFHVMVQQIMESDHPKALILHLNEHRDELDALAALPNPAAIARRIGYLEATLTATASPPAPAGNPVSLAPPPPATLGQKPATPADELADALATGDFARYRELKNRQELRTA